MTKEQFTEQYTKLLHEKFNICQSPAEVDKKFEQFQSLSKRFGVEGDLDVEGSTSDVRVLFTPKWEPLTN